MDSISGRIGELMGKGFSCSQAVLMVAQELRGEYDPAAVRAMAGLGGGLHVADVCGGLSGCCCVIASFGARGSEDEEDTLPYKDMIRELVAWFGEEFGSRQCSELVSSDRADRLATCPELVARTCVKTLGILEEQGVYFDG